jgi:hypothetical protein
MQAATAAMLAIACTACVADRQLQQLPTDDQLPWLVPGTTVRADIEQRLGPPGKTIEGDRIAVWSLVPDDRGGLRPRAATDGAPRASWRYVRPKEADETSLVVAFDPQQRAARVSLVKL